MLDKGIRKDKHRFTRACLCGPDRGFTLLEVLVSLAVMGTAITIILQLFSADLRALTASDKYLHALATASAHMREALENEALSEGVWSETMRDGSVVDITVTSTLRERTENLQLNLLDVEVKLRWAQGARWKEIQLKSMKVVTKKL